MYAKYKWMSKNDITIIDNVVYAKKLPILIAPFTRAELTIYYFYHGKRFSHSGVNCRCAVTPIKPRQT